MKKIVLSALLILPVISFAESDFKTKFSRPVIDIELSAFNLKEDALISRGSSTSLEGHFGYEIDEGFNLNLRPVISFIGGQQTSRDPQSPLTNTFYLKEASAEKNVGYDVKFKIGALYQKDFLPGLSGYIKSFPALGVIAPYTFSEQHKIQLMLQDAVITNSGLATNSSELVTNAYLLSGTLQLQSQWSSSLSSKFSFSHFKFDHLPSAVASDSINRGNTIKKLSASLFAFAYNYSGNEVVFETRYEPTDHVDIKFKSSYIKNSLAPKDLNSGYFLSFAPGFKVNAKYTLRPIVEHYYVQSDAMVADFLDSSYGRTNRKGNRYGVYLETEKYEIEVVYATSKLIESNPFQSKDQSVFVNLNIDGITF